ncbi:hypothetical protein Angca_000927, partial [Angiostrongylus cantonensis]
RVRSQVERLFRQNERSSRTRSLDCRIEQTRRSFRGTRGSAYSTRSDHRLLEENVNESVSGLSRSEKRMIKICWLKCSQKQLKKCAEDIFSDILHRDQTLLKLFKLELTPPSRLRSNEFFKSHAGNFAIVLNSVAINIGENFQKTCEALKILGYQHAALKSRGFQTAYWDIFTDCFEQNRPASFRKEKEKEAWSRMILFILAQMKIGYQRGLADQKMSVSVL